MQSLALSGRLNGLCALQPRAGGSVSIDTVALPWARSCAPSGRKTTNFMIHSQKTSLSWRGAVYTIILHKHGSAASRREHDRIIAEFIANGRHPFSVYFGTSFSFGSPIKRLHDYPAGKQNFKNPAPSLPPCFSKLTLVNSPYLGVSVCIQRLRRRRILADMLWITLYFR